ncbi:hypothetical protein [Flammeovirga kamogawensis]|uniref:Glycosyl transferase n=1 Tax=Flammeovirga kamogawensis TaxID=373891 RepID=A0ABX8GZA9_9BACT|nr:hypothetical protein [Flammeovirga kamogawensis]MBB6459353.1 hypothetical protein [Flammeovirga kamogawensis]QWG08910.1 hypothetical protein KM029_08195 [Flammeovirga kamogawensis]TRX67201.1 hypothetical protein EO216_03240 [Flammeovirga kamogawensis]
MRNIIIYQAYGMEEILNECIMSIHSLSKYDNTVDLIVIYTDSVSYLEQRLPKKYEYDFRKITHEQLVKWKGEYLFIHRVKIKVLLDYLNSSTFEQDFNLLYLDTDTIFTENSDVIFEKINNNILLMHDDEGVIVENKKNIVHKKLTKYLKVRFKEKGDFPLKQTMYNAGVLGFKKSDKELLDQVLLFSDSIHKNRQTHVSEQFAFSVIFSNQKDRAFELIKPFIYHYWNFKEYRTVLKIFFDKYQNSEAISNHFEKIDPRPLQEPKLAYEASGFLKKNIKKLFGKWKMPDYEI